MAVVVSDLAMTGDDAATPDLLAMNDAALPGIPRFHYVIDTLTMPTSQSDFPFDLNGDGRAYYQLGLINGVLIQENMAAFNLENAAQNAVITGTVLELISLATAVATGNEIRRPRSPSGDRAHAGRPRPRRHRQLHDRRGRS